MLAFVPEMLPPELTVTRELLRSAELARAAVSELTGQARLIKNINLVIRPLARREAVMSSRIEGTQTEIRELLMSETEEEPPDPDSDVFEVLNYLATIDLAQAWFDDGRNLDMSLVKELHARLLSGVRGDDKQPGLLRRKDVYIGNRSRGIQEARYVPPPMEHVASLMDDLFSFVSGPDAYTTLVDTAIAHYQFEAIHPFEDGNGRLGRLLVPLQLMQDGALDRPLVYLGPTLLERDQEYRDGLLAVSTQGKWLDWVLFMLDAMRVAASDALRRVQRLMELHEGYRQLIASSTSSKFPLVALDVVMDRTFVAVRDIERYAQTTYPTAKSAIETLVELKILVPHARIKGRQVWRAEQLLREVYED